MRNLTGIERIEADLKEQFYNNMVKYDAVPVSIDECTYCQTIVDNCSIGQLYALANLNERTKGIKLHSLDASDGTIYLNVVGLYGGMSLDGFINT